ncbi:MAG: Hsp20 family protein [Bacteriovoracaceae bacterium]|nr:Hsp20 family protein [Bacteriovoracaceae bacterium]
MSDKVAFRSALTAHKHSLHSMAEKHQNEIEKINLNHQKRKNQLENLHDQELVTRRNDNQKQLIEQAARQERTLEKLQKSLSQTKETTQAREVNLLDSLDKNIENQKMRHHEAIQIARTKHDMAMDEINQKASIEINRLQRKIDQKEAELKYASGVELSQAEEQGEQKLSMTKKSYLNKKYASEDKYQKALSIQKKNYESQIAGEERKHIAQLGGKTAHFDKQIQRIKSDGQLKSQKEQQLFEKKFQELQQNNEKLITKLLARKEKIIQKLRNEVLESHTLDAQKSDDPFYTVTSLDPVIEQEKDHYLVHLEIDEEGASEVELNGHKRDLTLSLNRRFENTDENNGAVEKVKRVETLTRSFNVDQIIDENKVEKNYNDGVLTFKIMKA